MDLRCTLRHVWGQSVRMHGREFAVDADGLCKAVPDEHALLFLRSSGWELVQKEEALAGLNERDTMLKLPTKEIVAKARALKISAIGKSSEELVDAILEKKE